MENVINNIPNSQFTAVRTGYNVTLTVTADVGYKFTGVIKAYYEDGYGNYGEHALTMSPDQKTATLTDEMGESQITLTGNTTADGVPEPNVINNIAGTTLTVFSDPVKIDITVQSGRSPGERFYDTGVTYTNTAGDEATTVLQITVNDYDSTAKVTITDADRTKPITVTGVFGGVHLVVASLTGCSSVNSLPEFVKPKGTLSVELKANENTEFEKAPVLSWNSEYGDYKSKNFDFSDGKTTATVTIDTSAPATDIGDYESISISADTVPVTVIGANYGSINVYRVTMDNLAAFAKKRFLKAEATEGEIRYTIIDMGQYVNRIKRIHVEIPTSSTDQIKCGNYATGIECLTPAVETVTIDFGSVNVPAPNGNATDYDSEVKVFLPFSGFVSLPNDYAGLCVTLTYIINVITGDGIAKLSHNDIVFQTAEVTAGTDVIYKLSETVVGGEKWDGVGLQGYEPYLYVKTFVSPNNAGRNSDSVRGQIGDFRGFNVLTDVTVIATDKMLTTEQETIYRALRSGVYID